MQCIRRKYYGSCTGFTLIELTIVVLVIGLLLGAITFGVGAVGRSRLRTSAVHLSAAIKTAYAWASMRGRPVRMVMDFDTGQFWLEQSEDRLLLALDDPSGAAGTESVEDAGAEDRNEDGMPDVPGIDLGEMGLGLDDLGIDVPEGMNVDGSSGFMFFNLSRDPFLAQLLPGTQGIENTEAKGYRPPKFRALPGSRGKRRELESDVAFKSVYTQHLETPVEEERAFLFFFPGGRTQQAIIQIIDDYERVISIKVHPLTGRVELVSEAVEPEGDPDEMNEENL